MMCTYWYVCVPTAFPIIIQIFIRPVLYMFVCKSRLYLMLLCKTLFAIKCIAFFTMSLGE